MKKYLISSLLVLSLLVGAGCSQVKPHRVEVQVYSQPVFCGGSGNFSYIYWYVITNHNQWCYAISPDYVEPVNYRNLIWCFSGYRPVNLNESQTEMVETVAAAPDELPDDVEAAIVKSDKSAGRKAD